MKNIYIVGAGGHGVVVAEIAEEVGFQVEGFIDDNPSLVGRQVMDWKVLGGRKVIPAGATVALAVGENTARADLLQEAEKSGWDLPVLIHPSSVISHSTKLGAGAIAAAHTVVNARAVIGPACILNTSSSVDHDCVLGKSVHIAPGVRLAGGVTVGDRTLIGIGSCVIPGIKIGYDCVIGAGSTVVSDIPHGSKAFGNPARVRKR